MPNIVIETITPLKAKALLELNSSNRHTRKGAISQYARDMKAGNWKMTGSPIVVNGKRLLDGQHRLLACVEAGVPFETVVLYDADESVHFAIDKGMKRTIADELKWLGEVDVAKLGAALGQLWKYERGVLQSPGVNPSAAELVSFLQERPLIRDSVRAAGRVNDSVPVPVTPFATAHFLVRTAHGEEIAEAFANKTCYGNELVQGDPILLLRNYAMNVASSRKFRPRSEEWLAVIIKAANYWLLGRTIRTLRWVRVGPKAEAFPVLVGADEVE